MATSKGLIYLENNNFDSLNVNVSLGNGDGTFDQSKTIGNVQFNGVSFTNSFEQAAEDWLNVYDYNDDGLLDVFVNAILEQSFVVFENNGIMSSSNEISHMAPTTVYPNPSSEILHVESLDTPSAIELINQNGQITKSIKRSKKINVSEVKAGLYFLRIHYDKAPTQCIRIFKA